MPLRSAGPADVAGTDIRRYLLDVLAAGRLGPGDRLPTERALVQRLGVPRSAVRDALAGLETQGHVVRIGGSGTYVADPSAPAGPGAVAAREAVLDDASPKEIMEARLLLEPRLAVLASGNATAGDFARLDHLLREGDAADSFAAFDAADDALHQAIADATHSRLVIQLYATIGQARRRAAWGSLRRRNLTPERRVASRREHHAIVAALKSREVDRAEAAILLHLRQVGAALLDPA